MLNVHVISEGGTALHGTWGTTSQLWTPNNPPETIGFGFNATWVLHVTVADGNAEDVNGHFIYPPAPPPIASAPPPPHCMAWCDSNQKSWGEKCSSLTHSCGGCEQCAMLPPMASRPPAPHPPPHPPPGLAPPLPNCMAWCETNWQSNCKLPNSCGGCVQCRVPPPSPPPPPPPPPPRAPQSPPPAPGSVQQQQEQGEEEEPSCHKKAFAPPSPAPRQIGPDGKYMCPCQNATQRVENQVKLATYETVARVYAEKNAKQLGLSVEEYQARKQRAIELLSDPCLRPEKDRPTPTLTPTPTPSGLPGKKKKKKKKSVKVTFTTPTPEATPTPVLSPTL